MTAPRRPVQLEPAIFGTNVRRLRTERKLTVRQLAERSGLRPDLIWQWEAGRASSHGPQPRLIGRLARGFGITDEELLIELALPEPCDLQWVRGPGGVMRPAPGFQRPV